MRGGTPAPLHLRVALRVCARHSARWHIVARKTHIYRGGKTGKKYLRSLSARATRLGGASANNNAYLLVALHSCAPRTAPLSPPHCRCLVHALSAWIAACCAAGAALSIAHRAVLYTGSCLRNNLYCGIISARTRTRFASINLPYIAQLHSSALCLSAYESWTHYKTKKKEGSDIISGKPRFLGASGHIAGAMRAARSLLRNNSAAVAAPLRAPRRRCWHSCLLAALAATCAAAIRAA